MPDIRRKESMMDFEAREARDVLYAILRFAGPLPVSDARERLAAALSSESGARQVIQDSLYRGRISLSEDRVLSHER